MYPRNYSAEEKALTNRPASSALLAVDAFDRYTNYLEARDTDVIKPAYAFTINKSESLMNGFFTRIGVSEVVFPWTIPNINPMTQEIVVEYTVGAGPVQTANIILEHSFLTPAQLAARLQIEIRALDAGLAAFTMTYGVKSVGLAYPVNLPVFQYMTNNPNTDIAFHPVAGGDPNRKQMFDLLGFTDEVETRQLEGFGEATYAQATRYIDIVCSQLTNNQALKDTMTQRTARDVLCRVYLGDAASIQSTVSPSSAAFCPPGCAPTIIYKNFTVPKFIQWLPNQPVPGNLKFEVFDDSGYNLDDMAPVEGESADWSLTLLVSEN